MKKARVIGPKDKGKLPDNSTLIYTVSHSTNWSKGLSPFFLGPCKLYGGYTAKKMENAWQYCKVYAKHTDANQDPTDAYWRWAKQGWADEWAHRYPMGKGAKPLYSWWDGQKLDYISARKKIYVPLYARAVKKTKAYERLKHIYNYSGRVVYLWDFDGYDNEALGMSLVDVLNDPTRTMGHAFILARMLEKDE